MAAITFATQLTTEGFLLIPHEIATELGLQAGDTVQVQIEIPQSSAAQELTPLERAVGEMTRRTPEQLAQAQQRAMERYQPRRPLPSDKTLADMVCGRWPGEEMEEQIQNALAELS